MSVVFRIIAVVYLCLAAVPSLACENPLKAIARKPVPASEQTTHAQGFDSCLNAFIENVPPESHDRLPEFLNELLLFATRYGDSAAVNTLLKERARLDPQHTDYDPRLLLDAASQGHSDVVQLLLGAGADPNDQTEPVSPLFAAISKGHAKTAQTLHEAGGEIRLPPSWPEGMTLIEDVIFGVSAPAATITLLIELGHDPSQPMMRGDLPIHAAAALGQGDVIRALAAGGADLEAPDREGHSPLETAAGSDHGLSALPALLDLQATAVGAALYEAELHGQDMNAAFLKALNDPEAQQGILDGAVIAFIQRGRGHGLMICCVPGLTRTLFAGGSIRCTSPIASRPLARCF